MYRVEIQGAGVPFFDLKVTRQLNRMGSASFRTSQQPNVGDEVRIYRRHTEIFRGFVVQVNQREGFYEVRCVDRLLLLKRKPFQVSYVDASLDDICEDIETETGVPIDYDSSLDVQTKTWDSSDELATFSLTNAAVIGGAIRFYAKPKLVKTTSYLRGDDSYPCESLPPYNGWTKYEESNTEYGHVTMKLLDSGQIQGNYLLHIEVEACCHVGAWHAGGVEKDFSSSPFKYGKLIYWHKPYSDSFVGYGVTGDNVVLKKEWEAGSGEYREIWADNITHVRLGVSVSVPGGYYNNYKFGYLDDVKVQEWAVKIRDIPDWIVSIKLYDADDNFLEELSTTNGEVYIDCLLYTSPSPRDLSTSRMPSSA